MSPQSSKTTRKPSALLGWFPTCPAAEQNLLQPLNARQLALWYRLRLHYWLTECRPISDAQVSRTRALMLKMDPHDTLTDEQAEEVIHPDFGFERDGDQWCIPELQEHNATALRSIAQKQEAGRRSGEARQARTAQPPAQVAPRPSIAPPQTGQDDDPANF